MSVNQVGSFEQGLLSTLRNDHADLLSDIASKQALDDDLSDRLKAAIEGYAKSFA